MGALDGDTRVPHSPILRYAVPSAVIGSMANIEHFTRDPAAPDRDRGHDYPNKLKVYKSGQKRGITPTIKKELRRRSAVEAVIGYMKTDGRLGRNFLKDPDGDRAYATLVGAGYNYRLVLKWLGRWLARMMAVILKAI
jgi:hypothetical protein